MSTRGLMGIRIDGEDKCSYNHFDSYPGGLGLSILKELGVLMQHGTANLIEKSRSLLLVSEDTKLTPEQIILEKEIRNSGEYRGKLIPTLECGLIVDGNNFILDSLFCEWAYIVNVNTLQLEVYVGFQEKPHTNGRYADVDAHRDYRSNQYYPCALIATFLLENLPTESEFLIAISRAPHEREEDMVLEHLEECGDISRQQAKDHYGITEFDSVLDNLKDAGYKFKLVNHEMYQLEE